MKKNIAFLLLTIIGVTTNFIVNPIKKATADGPTVTAEQCMEAPYNGRISFCHATSSETNPYVFLSNMPCQSAFQIDEHGAGHFDENGTILSGHENPDMGTADYFTDDETCGGTIGIEPTPTPTPTPTVTPSPTPTVTPTPEPTATPEPEDKNKSSLEITDPTCDSNIVYASHTIKENNQGIEGVRVVFTYNGAENIVYTNNEGVAKTNFAYTSNAHIDSRPDGLSSAFSYITEETNCDAEANTDSTDETSVNDSEDGNNPSSSQVAYTVTGGQVLGASTEIGFYANAGVTTDILMAIMGVSGVGLTTAGIILNGKNGRKNS